MPDTEKGWEAKVDFMRKHEATAAEWDGAGNLLKVALSPKRPTPAAPVDTKPADPLKGAVARLMKQHEIQFAHSRVKPPMPSVATENVVPRAVAAKTAASRGTKAQKRAS